MSRSGGVDATRPGLTEGGVTGSMEGGVATGVGGATTGATAEVEFEDVSGGPVYW